MNKGVLVVLSGPSGSGKGTVAKQFMEESEDTYLSISATTRDPRPGEVRGVHYSYVSKDQFLEMINRDELLEYAEYVGNFYGTPAKPVDEMLKAGKNVLLEIDIQGGLQVCKKRPDAILVFLVPPSLEELEKRLRGRGTETDEVIAQRLKKSFDEYELASEVYNYVIENSTVELAVEKLKSIFIAERCRADRVPLSDFIPNCQEERN